MGIFIRSEVDKLEIFVKSQTINYYVVCTVVLLRPVYEIYEGLNLIN